MSNIMSDCDSWKTQGNNRRSSGKGGIGGKWGGGHYTKNRINRMKMDKIASEDLALNDVNVFPVLGNRVENVDRGGNMDIGTEFANALTTEVSKIKAECVKDIKSGWTIINKNDGSIKTYNNIGRMVNGTGMGIIETDYYEDDIPKMYTDMCKRWCNYYDEINDLVGDRSPYFNYKNEIREIVSEENIIMNRICGGDYNYSSDDEKDEMGDDVHVW